jgi:hypothetical protein
MWAGGRSNWETCTAAYGERRTRMSPNNTVDPCPENILCSLASTS